MRFVSFSYKVPAKGDGVDYVRTEDEVCTSIQMPLQFLNNVIRI